MTWVYASCFASIISMITPIVNLECPPSPTTLLQWESEEDWRCTCCYNDSNGRRVCRKCPCR